MAAEALVYSFRAGSDGFLHHHLFESARKAEAAVPWEASPRDDQPERLRENTKSKKNNPPKPVSSGVTVTKHCFGL